MATRNVVLTETQSDLVDRLVASGRYQNASEALRAGIVAWPSGGRPCPAVLRAAWRGTIPGGPQALRTAAEAGQGWVAS